MNGRVLLLFSLVYFGIAYCVYGKFLAKKFGVDSKRPCPSHTRQDGVDYVPTHPMVLFGHHFASIAGAGPIVGPVIAACYGWLPALLWILLGCVFIGSMHDFAAMFLSVRNNGYSIAYVIEKELGYWGRQLFLFFCMMALILVVAVFASQVADGFLANPGVATSSILFILIAPIFGILTFKKMLTLWEASLIFVPLVFILVWIGPMIPMDLMCVVGSKTAVRNIWIGFLLYYITVASIIPVWFLLQPRDYLNSYLLYGMMGLGIMSVVCAAPTLQTPAFHLEGGSNVVPSIFPLLFITIACGACSGFHALVSSGTSAKQLDKENHALPIAYGGMLLEGALAILAVISVCYLDWGSMKEMLMGANKVPAPIAFAKGLAHFSAQMGLKESWVYDFISLAISAFMLTSLDTATRLTRFILQEFLMPRRMVETTDEKQTKMETGSQPKWISILRNRWIATLVVVFCGGYLALSGDALDIWPVFGASNQLMAGLTLLGVTLWLLRKKHGALFAMLPMFFMMFISVWALIYMVKDKWGQNWTLVTISVVLIILALCVLGLGIKTIRKRS